MPTLRFSRQQRLTHKKEFDRVFNQATFKFGTAHFLVLAFFRSDEEPGRLGLVASKKHLKTSVNRNRFKRQTRESFRLKQHLLMGCDVVVLSRPQSTQCETLVQALTEVWTKLERKRRKFSPSTDTEHERGPTPS